MNVVIPHMHDTQMSRSRFVYSVYTLQFTDIAITSEYFKITLTLHII